MLTFVFFTFYKTESKAIALVKSVKEKGYDK